MGKFNLNHHLTVAKPLDNGLMWYECAEYTDVKEYIKNHIQKIKENFVSIGYWLKYVNENKMYVEDGYSSIEEFAESVYKISRSTAYRLMEMNTEFSKNGNSPELAEEYKDFSKSQLQELLSLTTEQRKTVTPDMTVNEIRNIKKENYPDDGTIRTFAQQMLRDWIKAKDYSDVKVLKEYLYENFGRSHASHASDRLSYESDLKGIVFNHLSTNPDDKMTWNALAKRILDLYKLDPLTLEYPAQKTEPIVQIEQQDEPMLDGQLEIVNVDMEVQEHRGTQDEVEEKRTDEEYTNPSNENRKICTTGLSKYGFCNCCGSGGVTCCAKCEEDCNSRCGWLVDQNIKPEDNSSDEEVLNILSYTCGDEMASIPFINEEDMFIFGDGQKCALTMKLQKYLAAQFNLIDLSKYRLEIRAVKIK